MKSALVIIADGSEELEAVTIIDLLRRAKLDVTVAGLSAEPIEASRGVRIVPDVALTKVRDARFDLLVLPGGLGGTQRLAKSDEVRILVERQLREERLLGAICAAPSVLREFGLLCGREVTSFPGAIPAEDDSYRYSESSVVDDGYLVTSRGPGTAMDFTLRLIERLCGASCADEVEASLMRPRLHLRSAGR